MLVRRAVAAVVAGLLCGGVVVGIMEYVAHLLYPLPEGLDPFDPASRDAVAEHVRNLPGTALALVLLAHFAGAVTAGAVGSLISRWRPVVCGMLAGGVLMLGGIANLFALPHPVWFGIADVLLYLPSAWLGSTAAAMFSGKLLVSRGPGADSEDD